MVYRIIFIAIFSLVPVAKAELPVMPFAKSETPMVASLQEYLECYRSLGLFSGINNLKARDESEDLLFLLKPSSDSKKLSYEFYLFTERSAYRFHIPKPDVPGRDLIRNPRTYPVDREAYLVDREAYLNAIIPAAGVRTERHIPFVYRDSYLEQGGEFEKSTSSTLRSPRLALNHQITHGIDALKLESLKVLRDALARSFDNRMKSIDKLIEQGDKKTAKTDLDYLDRISKGPCAKINDQELPKTISAAIAYMGESNSTIVANKPVGNKSVQRHSAP